MSDIYIQVKKGGAVGLPRTYAASRNTYDDGYFSAGIPLSIADRFVDNLDGTITDLATGLMWGKYFVGRDTTGTGSPTIGSYNSLLSNVATNSYAGYSDWRLPNMLEILSLYGQNNQNDADFLDFFPDATYNSDLWISTPPVSGTGRTRFITTATTPFDRFTSNNSGNSEFAMRVRG